MVASADGIASSPGLRVRPLGRLIDWITASDPAFSRLRLSSRALLALLVTGAALAGFSFLVHQLPIAAYGLAVVVAFVGSMGVRDTGWRAQAVTRLWCFAASVLIVLVAGVLAPLQTVADVGFLVVIFGAVYIRTYGPRWFVVGLMSFMAYFMGDYLRPQASDIGWLAVASAIAFVITQLVTVNILPDNPERDFRRSLVTVEHRINLILHALLASRANGGPVDRAPLQQQLSLLRDTIMMAEGFIPQGEKGSLAAAGAASDLAVALFELQLVVERMVRASYIALPPESLLLAVLRRDGGEIHGAAVGGDDADSRVISARLLQRVGISLDRLDKALGPRPSPAFALGTTATTPAVAAAATPSTYGVPLPLQLPIQVTLACAIAMGCGLLLSPSRWYWAVLTAFIVFNNAKSRADTAVRALQRSAGTLVGLFGGIALATMLHGQLIASAVAIPVLFFIAFYFLAVSYGIMIFFVTLAVALLYGLLGSFTPELLVLRLEETVVGSIAGTAVAFFVFPARASATVAGVLERYLDALDDLLRAVRGRAHGEPEPQHLLARSRLLDRAYTDLAAAVRPLGGPWGAVTRFGEVRERLLLLTGCAHWGRVLARSLRPGEPLPPDRVERLDQLVDEVQGRVAAARLVKGAFFDRPDVAPGAVTAATPRPPVPIAEEEDPAFALAVISALLDRATLASGVEAKDIAGRSAGVFP